MKKFALSLIVVCFLGICGGSAVSCTSANSETTDSTAVDSTLVVDSLVADTTAVVNDSI